MDLFLIAARVSRLRHKDRRERFSFSEFKALDTIEEMQRYASRLQALGRGTSRAAYALTSGRVLKVAAPLDGHGASDAGIEQNRAEVDIYTDPRTKPVCAVVYDADPGYRWIVSEIVRPLSGEVEFESLTGSDMFVVAKAVEMLDSGVAVDDVVSELAEEKITPDMIEVFSNLMERDLSPGDMLRPDQWGKTSSGRVVLFDYGLTGSASEFYTDERELDELRDEDDEDEDDEDDEPWSRRSPA
jgi:hypothetical protein